METINVVFFLVASIIVGSMMILLISGWNYHNLYDATSNIINHKNKLENTNKVSYSQFIFVLANFGKTCMEENTGQMILYVNDNRTITKSKIFDDVKKLSLCESLQSVSNGCGSKESIADFNIKLPAVIKLSCNNHIVELT